MPLKDRFISAQIDTAKTIELIYDAVGNPAGWRVLLDSLVESTNSRSGRFILDKLDRSAVLASTDVGFDPAFDPAYKNHYISKDLWTNALEPQPKEQFFNSLNLVPQKDYLSSEFFNDWAREQDIHYATGMYLSSDSESSLRFCLQRTRSGGCYTEQDIASLNLLGPHLKRAVDLYYQFNQLQLFNKSTTQILDQLPLAAFLLDQDSAIRYQNSQAEGLLSEGIQLKVLGNRLVLTGSEGSRFSLMIHDAVASGQGQKAGSQAALNVFDTNGEPQMEVSVSPLVVDDSEFGFQYRKVMALVYIKDSKNQPRFSIKTAMELYGFTRKEAQICHLLCCGYNVEKIAARTSTSFHTVRTHIKRLLRKTNSNSQSQVVSVVLSGLAAYTPSE